MAKRFWAPALLLLAIGALIRFVALDTNPPGLWQDEASTGLDAWLIWHTGRDRAGDFMPLIARSFGDYPLALYRYLDAPIVGVFGLSIQNERLVAAFFGTVMLLSTAMVVRLRAGDAAALAALLASVLCPTWLHFSRYGSEAILLPSLLVSGWALIEWTAKRERYAGLWIGALLLGLSAYTYHAVKLVLPIWLAGFLVFQWPLIRSLWTPAKRKHLIGSALIFALVVAPSAYLAFTPGGEARGRTVLAWYHWDGIELFRVIASHYLSYFDPGMLFVRGGPAIAQSIPGLGMWNFIELPLIIAGFATMLRPGPARRFFAFVVFWFLLGPLPGGLTYESNNMGRAIAWLPAPQIISGAGLAAIVAWGADMLRDRGRASRVAGGAVVAVLVIAWALTGYAVVYNTLIRFPKVAQRDFQFEISGALQCARDARTDERVIVSPGFQMGNVFAQFFFGELDLEARTKSGDPNATIWQMADRTEVGPRELYVFLAGRPVPKGREVCRISPALGGQPVAFVFTSEQPRSAWPLPSTEAPIPWVKSGTVAPARKIERVGTPPTLNKLRIPRDRTHTPEVPALAPAPPRGESQPP